MLEKLRNCRISFQLGLLQTLLQFGVAICLATAVGYLAKKHLVETVVQDLHGQNKTAIAAFASYDRVLTPLVNAHMGRVRQALSGKIAPLAPGQLSYDGKPGAAAFTAAASALLAQTGTQSSILAKNGEEFVRVASVLNKEDGSTAVGTTLDHKSPAFAALSKGQGFIGLVRIFGKTYLARYESILDGTTVVGAFAVLASLEQELAGLNEGMSSVKIGETGYLYALDSDGTALVHPKLAGKSVWGAKDADGTLFIQEMLAAKQGVRYYHWANPDEKKPRQKIVAFDTYTPWGVLVGTGSYIDELTVTANALVGALLLACLVALVVQVALMQYVTGKAVVQPLSALAESMNRVASGDLTVSPLSYDDTKSEVRRIEQAAGKAVSFMHDVVISARESATAVAASADNLSRVISESSQASFVQTEETQSVAAAVEELAVSAASISEMVAQAAEGSKRSSELAQSGIDHVSVANSRARELAASATSTVSTIQKLGVDAKQIAGAGALIRSIAEQTNLLSLNAAIEAARAGEQGRGFAVVADEVRRLAGRTSDATKNIDTLVSTILEQVTAVQDAVHGVESGSGQSVAAVEQASQSFATIHEAAEKSSSAMQSAKDATSEQRSASESVARSVERIADHAGAVAHATQAAESEARLLGERAHRLHDKVANFRV